MTGRCGLVACDDCDVVCCEARQISRLSHRSCRLVHTAELPHQQEVIYSLSGSVLSKHWRNDEPILTSVVLIRHTYYIPICFVHAHHHPILVHISWSETTDVWCPLTNCFIKLSVSNYCRMVILMLSAPISTPSPFLPYPSHTLLLPSLVG